ncbi:DUF7536 family protein [Haloarchaeobius sp. DFWS5]|uniref:DUF7536 family protein n=1 Tax=Haloarchaeobius sp. DFWS5 TaxID=3446114 RepID=UPI003EBF9805
MSENTDVTDDRPDRPPALRFFEALGVRRHAKWGLFSGVVLAFVLVVFFVVLPSLQSDVQPRTDSPALFAVLGFVIVVSTALFVTTVLTARTVAGYVMSPPKWIRRAGIVGALGGVVWVGLAALASTAVAAGSGPSAGLLSATSLLLAPGIWAVYTRLKYDTGDLAKLAVVASGVGLLGVHAGALLVADPVLSTTASPLVTPFSVGLGLLLVGTATFGLVAREALGTVALVAVGACVVSGVGFGLVAADVAGGGNWLALLTVPPVGLAWLALGIGCRSNSVPAGWSPDDERDESLGQFVD